MEANQHVIQELLKKKQFFEADRLLSNKIKEQSDDAESHYLLGVSSYFQGKINETIEHLKKALELNPKNTDAAICLSVLYNDIGKYDDAKKVFEQANQSVSLKKVGDDSEVDRKFALKHLELADMYFRYRRYDEALEEYSKSTVLDPMNVEVRIKKAKAFAKKGFSTRAVQELQQLGREFSTTPNIPIQLGLLYYSQGNLLDAELQWERALELDPANREAESYIEMVKRSNQKALQRI